MKLSHKGMQVLIVFMNDSSNMFAGSDLVKRTNIGAGTMYPLLARFEAEDILKSEWEKIDPRAEGRPRKRFYRITARGRQIALEYAGNLRDAGGLAWALGTRF